MNDLLQRILIIWNQPHPWSKLKFALKDKFFGKLWCMQRSISSQKAIKEITGKIPEKTFKEKFSKEFKKAKATAETAPVKMGGEGSLDLIYFLSKSINPTKIVETGVAYGWSSLAFLLSLKDKRQGLLISTDLPYSNETAPYAGCVVPQKLKSKWNFIQKSDKEALPEIASNVDKIDICHYNSDKSYEGRMFAYPILWKMLRDGGIFISDDIGDNFAFRDFAKSQNTNIFVVRDSYKYVGVLIKDIK
jgi:predicted O-methyltransferase YrrM